MAKEPLDHHKQQMEKGPRVEDYMEGPDEDLNVTGLKVRTLIRSMQSKGISDDEINEVLPTLLKPGRK
jgi:hypothetical protein